MAVENFDKKKFVLYLNDGISAEGKTIYKLKTYNNVKQTASADEILNVASALASLQQLPVENIMTDADFTISA